MKVDIIDLPIRVKAGFEAAYLTAILPEDAETLTLGFAFADPILAQVKINPDSPQLDKFENEKIEESAGSDAIAVTGGLRWTTSGDTAFAILHTGLLPSFVRKMLGKEVTQFRGEKLREFLNSQSGGMGAFLRHSVMQIFNNEYRVRRSKEPGMLWDTSHTGDFIFGLTPSGIWREPYLNAEKRETLRSDLCNNLNIHRDDAGNFWFLGTSQRLLRMEQTDIKAKPTPLKLGDLSGLFVSVPTSVDGWMYATSENSKTLVRIRMNPISLEEEIQTVQKFMMPVTGLYFDEAVVASESDDEEDEENDGQNAQSSLYVFVENPKGAEVWKYALTKQEDPEIMGEVPVGEKVHQIPGVSSVSSLTLSPSQSGRKKVLWGAEHALGISTLTRDEKTSRLIRITGL